MESKQRRLRLTIIIPAIILWLTANLYYLWIKVAGIVLLVTGIIELVCFLTTIIGTIILTIRIIKHSRWRNLKNYLSIGLLVFMITVLNIQQLRVNENTFQSPVEIRACYEGTMSTSYLFFRENGTFEDFNIGWFAYVHYSYGTWNQYGDTLLLDFLEEKPRSLEEKMIIKDENLYKLQADTLAPTNYNLGHCKGLN